MDIQTSIYMYSHYTIFELDASLCVYYSAVSFPHSSPGEYLSQLDITALVF